jgi:hypothetical protein
MLVFIMITFVSMLVAMFLLLYFSGPKAINSVIGKKILPEANVNPTAGMTDVSKFIYKAYMDLPEDSRPYEDIATILRGLDKRHALDMDAMRQHFNVHEYRILNGHADHPKDKFITFGWTTNCSHTSRHLCDFSEYGEIYLAIAEIKKSAEERERKLLESGTQGYLDDARLLVERLREEAEIQRQVTKELL